MANYTEAVIIQQWCTPTAAKNGGAKDCVIETMTNPPFYMPIAIESGIPRGIFPRYRERTNLPLYMPIAIESGTPRCVFPKLRKLEFDPC